jgi:hypothetical protein
MKKIITGSNEAPGTTATRHLMVLNILLICGILSSLFYIGLDIIASMQWEGYSYTAQAFSELTAVEAPTRPLMVFGSVVYNLLVIACAVGIWKSADGKRTLYMVAVFLAAHAITGFIGGVVFPMHSRGQTAMTPTDVMHITATMAEVLSLLLLIGFGAATFGKGFRFYSIGTILLLILGGTLAGLDGSRVAAGLPTPWLGVTERINIYASMLWILVLAVALLCTFSNSLRLEERQRIVKPGADINRV